MKVFIASVGISAYEISTGRPLHGVYSKAFIFREEAETYILEMKQRRSANHMVWNISEQELGARSVDIAPAECLTYVNVIEHEE